jgi:hypothetical protein
MCYSLPRERRNKNHKVRLDDGRKWQKSKDGSFLRAVTVVVNIQGNLTDKRFWVD